MTVIKFTCPNCAAGLKSTDPGVAGKKIKCPKCATPFLVPVQTIREHAPATGRTSLDAGKRKPGQSDVRTKTALRKRTKADMDNDEDDEEEGEESSGSGKKILIWGSVGGGVLLLLLAVVVVVLVFKPFSKRPVARAQPAQPPVEAAQRNPPAGAAATDQDKIPTLPPFAQGARRLSPDGGADRPVDNPFPDKLSMMPLRALGTQERLDKLKVVRLEGKASFAETPNINNITLMWRWEPRIMVRMVELHREEDLAKFVNLTKNLDRTREELIVNAIVKEFSALGQVDAANLRELEAMVRASIKSGDWKTLLDAVVLIDGSEVYQIMGNRIRIQLNKDRAVRVRNLSFALSVSNLVPLKRLAFDLEAGGETNVRGKNCRQFKLRTADGLKVEFYFDLETDLLIKVAHQGNNPHKGALAGEVKWEHYFSDYKETDGIKQWRRLEIQVDNKPFATFDVTDVQYFDQIPPELSNAPEATKPNAPAP